MKIFARAAGALLALSFLASCSSSPPASTSAPLTAAHAPIVLNGGQPQQIQAGDTLQLPASTTGGASINIPHGTAPTSPTNGDCWTTTAGFFCRISGATKGPYADSASALAAISANSVVGNFTGSSAAPSTTSLPNCNGGNVALQYTTGSPGTVSCGNITGGGGGGVGTVTTSGSPANNDMTRFTGSTVVGRSGITSDGVALLQTGTTKLASGKAVTVTHGSSQTLLSHSGRGHIARIWFSSLNSGDASSVLSSTFTITRDGEGTPSINAIQDQDLFARRSVPGGQYFQSENYGCRGVDSTGHLGAPCYITIDIPFDSSITVSWTNASSSSTATIWWEIEYVDDDADLNRGTREHLHATKVSASVTAYSEQTLIDVSGPAMLVGITGQFRGGDGNYNYQEGKVQAYIDSEGTASFQSSGTEDFFQQSDYGRNAGPSTSIAFRSFGIPYADGTATIDYYRWLIDRPIYGASHLKTTWTNGISSVATVTNATAIDLVVWYYTAS